MPDLDAERRLRRTRQKTTVVLLAVFLLLAGVLLIFVLKQVPLPMRVFLGLSNLIAGSVLLLLVRQKFRR